MARKHFDSAHDVRRAHDPASFARLDELKARSVMTWQTHGVVGSAVREYTGRQVVELEVVADPNVVGVFAVRALTQTSRKACDPRIDTFLIKSVPLQKVTADDLEEVSFTTWPPEVRS